MHYLNHIFFPCRHGRKHNFEEQCTTIEGSGEWSGYLEQIEQLGKGPQLDNTLLTFRVAGRWELGTVCTLCQMLKCQCFC